MHKLGITDASFLYLETDAMPMNIASVQKFQPAAGVDWFEQLRGHLAERVGGVPFMIRRLKATPLALDHPVWVEDTAFDISQHLVRMRVPAPGTDAQLEALVARLHEEPLDRRRPLWKYYYIDGLADGTVALYEKYHHACIDGVAAQSIIDVLFSEDAAVVPPAQPCEKAENPDTLDLLFDAARGMVRQAFAGTQDLGARLKAATRLTERWLSGEGFGAMDLTVPRTPFNVAISPYRAWSSATLSLPAAKRVARAGHATLNDVVLAVCAGALRRYLMRHDALPETPLVCGVPVSLRAPGDTSLRNQVTMLMANLATHIESPADRLAAIRASTRESKKLLTEALALQVDELHLPGLGRLLNRAAALTSDARLANLMPAAVNVVISNVPGPRTRRWLCGAELLTHYPVSIPGQSVALNMTVQSYADRLDFGLTACLEAVPDLADLRDDLLAAWSELAAAYPSEAEGAQAQPTREQNLAA